MLQQYQRIMVAVDGSSESELAFKKAVNVAQRNDSELVLAHVIDTRAFQTVSSFDGMLAEQATEMAKQTLKDYEDYARKHQVTAVKTVIFPDRVWHMIFQFYVMKRTFTYNRLNSEPALCHTNFLRLLYILQVYTYLVSVTCGW